MKPVVSVVIPCYKGSRFLAESIESCLAQTFRDLEVIVVDDASPERDAEIAEAIAARDPRVRVVRHPRNRGVSEAYNTGYRLARGDFFTRLSQDDLFRSDAIALLLDRLRAEPDVGLVYCDMQKIDEAGNILALWPQGPDPDHALFPTQEVGLCVMWRRTVYEVVGPFRSRFDFAEDYEFYLRVSRRFRLAKCGDEAPFFFRCHPHQGSAVFEKKQAVNYVRAQLSHHWAMARTLPLRLEHWKGVVGCSLRFLTWSTQLRLGTRRATRRPGLG